MQKNKKVQNFKEGGITLIALVITIIVLLILAGVAISALTGDSGILSNAEKAKKDTDQATLEEVVSLKVIEYKYPTEKNKDKTLKQYLEEISDAETTEIREGAYQVTRREASVIAYGDGDILTGKAWNGNSEVPEFDEDGNWYIYNGEQLKFFADTVNNTNSQLTDTQKTLITKAGYDPTILEITDNTIVYLMEDIELGGNATINADGSLSNIKNEWKPIGNAPNGMFVGTFEGNNHYISGCYVSETNNITAGLFGGSYTIKNLTIKNSYIYSVKPNVGGIVGVVMGGDLIDCHNINTQVRGENINVGGIVGYFIGNKIEKCTNSGNINAGIKESASASQIGGIVGFFSGNSNAKIIDCTNTGNVTALGKFVGGILGIAVEISIEQCNNSGNIQSEEKNVGGIAGNIQSNSTITSCNNTGEIISEDNFVGGILGNLASACKVESCNNSGKIITRHVVEENEGGIGAGGIVGVVNESDVSGTDSIVNKCYNSGTIEGVYIGGIVGVIVEKDAGNATITNCYSKGKLETKFNSARLGAIIGSPGSSTGNTINNLYYLESVGIKAINGADDETNNVKSTTKDLKSLQAFLEWLGI